MIALVAIAVLDLSVTSSGDLESVFDSDVTAAKLMLMMSVVCAAVAVSSTWSSCFRLGLVDAICLMAAMGAALVHMSGRIDEYSEAWQLLTTLEREVLVLAVYVILPIGLASAPLFAGARYAWGKWAP